MRGNEMELLNNLFSIAIDCGKFNTKAVFENMGVRESLIMRTTLRKNHDTVQVLDNVHCISINGQKYTVGDSEDGLSPESIKLDKNSELHEIATLTMIAKALNHCKIKAGKDANLKVNLCINIPLSQYVLPQKRAEIEALYSQKEIKITLDGTDYNFTIENVLVLYEGAGILVKYNEFLKNRNVYVVDCGGLNVTRLSIVNGKINTKTLKTGSEGCNALAYKIYDEVNSKYDRKLLESDIMKALRGEDRFKGKNADEINALVSEKLEEFTQSIVMGMTNDVDLDSHEILLLGGSSDFYYPILTKELNRTLKLSNNAILDNVEGFFHTMKLKGL